MAAKRSRVARSSSLAEIGPVNQVHSVESAEARWEKSTPPFSFPRAVQNSVKNSKTYVAKPEQYRRRILTLASPVRETNKEMSEMNIDEWIGGFLEACYFCKKKISQEDNVFMYGYLRAFCTPECRDEQIVLDKEVEKASGEPT